SIEQIFSGKPALKGDEIKASRKKYAAQYAAQQKRDAKDIERGLLADDFKRQYLQKLEQEQIAPFPFTEREASSVKQVKVYSAIEIKYLSKEAEIIPVHYQIESLEYELASRILKLTTDEKPVVALFDGRKPPAPPMDPMRPMQPPRSDYEQITQYLSQFFD